MQLVLIKRGNLKQNSKFEFKKSNLDMFLNIFQQKSVLLLISLHIIINASTIIKPLFAS